MAIKMTKAEFKEDIVSKLTHIFGVTPEEATYEQYYKASGTTSATSSTARKTQRRSITSAWNSCSGVPSKTTFTT